MPADFTTKDSGQHEQYDSGMRRDTNAGKPRFDLIRTKRQAYDEQMIYRYAMLLARGADKYDPRNWENGDSEAELDRAKESLLRHTEQLIAGETDEDHAAAVWFNAQAVEYFRWRIEQKSRTVMRTFLPVVEVQMENVSPEAIALITGRALNDKTRTRWTMATSSKSDEEWTAPAPTVQSLELQVNEDDFSARKAHQDAINAWHNRPRAKVDDVVWTGDYRTDEAQIEARKPWLKPGPRAIPEDRLRDEVERQAGLVLARPWPPNDDLPVKRIDDWLKEFGIEIVEGDLGDPYHKVHIVEFAMRLRTAKKIEKSPVDDRPVFN